MVQRKGGWRLRKLFNDYIESAFVVDHDASSVVARAWYVFAFAAGINCGYFFGAGDRAFWGTVELGGDVAFSGGECAPDASNGLAAITTGVT